MVRLYIPLLFEKSYIEKPEEKMMKARAPVLVRMQKQLSAVSGLLNELSAQMCLSRVLVYLRKEAFYMSL